MAAVVDCVWPARAVLGEGPLWSPADQALWWVDIKGLALCRYRPADGDTRRWSADEAIGCLALDAAGGLVAATWSGFHRLRLEGERVAADPIARPAGLPPQVRFNDGAVAPDGAFWAGTMDNDEDQALGDWWRLDGEGRLTRTRAGFMVTNGPAFDPARGRTYLTDSAERRIYVCDGWGPEAAQSRRPWRTFDAPDGYPDGMAVDARGWLWVAFWDGGCVRALDPDSGAVAEEVPLPARRPTSIAFGGAALDVMYVTSASIGLETPGEADGGLFAIAGLGVTGLAVPDWTGPA